MSNSPEAQLESPRQLLFPIPHVLASSKTLLASTRGAAQPAAFFITPSPSISMHMTYGDRGHMVGLSSWSMFSLPM